MIAGSDLRLTARVCIRGSINFITHVTVALDLSAACQLSGADEVQGCVRAARHLVHVDGELERQAPHVEARYLLAFEEVGARIARERDAAVLLLDALAPRLGTEGAFECRHGFTIFAGPRPNAPTEKCISRVHAKSSIA